ncbi:hypothetical protein [Defluviimonas sp. WL0075]|uniref:Uncharacterized protein n=1 Tax=Albidovulum sediminicola TaxID=2984331 RepID=A0ABT2Z0Y2_9RHOB|nr:hypothetical protein [Defluviimonas sp. WL0075]MCV2864753.1 hypothetical protein [Defluviimonas sp. WL0075]
MILASMAAQSEIAAERIETFDNRFAGDGGYLALNAGSRVKC